MTTRVLLVRHGGTVLSAEDRFAGSTDVALSDEGSAQAQALAERLADVPITAIYASSMGRTRETATILGAPRALAPSVDDGLREISHGRWEGLTRKEVEARFPEEYATWEQDPFTFAPEGGESGLSVMARALPVIRSIVLGHPGQTVAVVSPKATLRLVVSSLLGIDARGYRDRLDQPLRASTSSTSRTPFGPGSCSRTTPPTTPTSRAVPRTSSPSGGTSRSEPGASRPTGRAPGRAEAPEKRPYLDQRWVCAQSRTSLGTITNYSGKTAFLDGRDIRSLACATVVRRARRRAKWARKLPRNHLERSPWPHPSTVRARRAPSAS